MNVPHDLALTGGCDSAMQGLIEQVVAAELGFADPDFDPAHPTVARAVSLGLVSRDGPSVHVADPAFRHDTMVRVAAGMALDTWKDVDRFVSAMDNICHRGYVLGYGELGGRVLVELARRGADIISRLQEIALEAASAEARRSFWTLYASYCKALPDLDPDPEQLAIALDPIVDVVAADLASGELVGAVKRLGARSPESAEALFQAFARRGSAPSSCLAGAVLQSLAFFDLASAHTHAVALTEAEAPALQATGILALGDLPYEEAAALREATMARLSGMLAGAGPVQGRALAHAFGALLPAERAGAGLLDLSLRADRGGQQAVAEALLRTVDTSGGESWFAEALLNVASRSAEARQRLSPLDAVAAHLVEIDPGRAAAVIGAWAAGGGTGSGSETEWKLADTFPSTLRRLRESGLDALEAAVTSWFISDDSRLHQAAADIVTAHDFDAEWDRRRPIRLSAPVLGELSKPAVRRLVLRILGYVIGGQPLAALLVSVLDRDPCPPVLVSFIGETLDHALYEYPVGAGAYLRALAASDVAPLLQREAAEAALDRSTGYIAQRRELPRLVEFEPPSNRTLLVRLAQQKRQADAIETAREDSAFLQLVRRVPLKYGRGYADDARGTAAEPVALNSFTYEVEVPRGALTDPLGQELQRSAWRAEGLPDSGTAEEGEEVEG